jgi:hypothetical protein
MKRIFLTFISLACAFLVVACSPKKIATNVVSEIALDGMTAVEDEDDLVFARESAPALIKTLEVLSYGDKNNKNSMVLLSKAYGQYAFGFLEEEMLASKHGTDAYNAAKARASEFYRRGKDYGLKAMARFMSIKDPENAPFPIFEKGLKGLSKKAVPAMFWAAFSWANWLNLNSTDPAAIIALPKIEAMARRAAELDSGYGHGSTHALIAVIAASRPSMLGGSDELAKKEFDEAMGIAPDYLMTKVLYAQYYARRTGDQALFDSTLGAVISADIGGKKEQALANTLARRRAKILLAMKKELF